MSIFGNQIRQEQIVDHLTVHFETKSVQYRVSTLTKNKDGQEIAPRSFWRRALVPGDDLTGVPPAVQGICRLVWGK